LLLLLLLLLLLVLSSASGGPTDSMNDGVTNLRSLTNVTRSLTNVTGPSRKHDVSQ
jgi:hypothetical protein